MRTTTFSILFIGILLSVWACTPNRGCNELTADNFDQAAEEDDGTCIASRDKMIGNFTYTRAWTDVILQTDSVDFGNIAITEKNTAGNAFNMNINAGGLILFGSTKAYAITIDQFSLTDTFFGQSFNRSYSGSGTWLEADSVDFTFNVVTQVPMWDGATPPGIVTVPQTYNYYCTQVP
jgi:hypothetical protein